MLIKLQYNVYYSSSQSTSHLCFAFSFFPSTTVSNISTNKKKKPHQHDFCYLLPESLQANDLGLEECLFSKFKFPIVLRIT